jgi:hypothetical protein
MSEGRWASRERGSKRARVRGHGRRTRGRGRVHSGEIVGERLGTADRWGRRDRERERQREWAQGKRTAPTAWPDRAARERERGRVSALGFASTGGARLSDTKGAWAQACARGLGLLGWFGLK